MKGHGDLVSRLITPISSTRTPVMSITNLLRSLHDPPSRAEWFGVSGFRGVGLRKEEEVGVQMLKQRLTIALQFQGLGSRASGFRVIVAPKHTRAAPLIICICS